MVTDGDCAMWDAFDGEQILDNKSELTTNISSVDLAAGNQIITQRNQIVT